MDGKKTHTHTYIIFPKTVDLSSGKGVPTHKCPRRRGFPIMPRNESEVVPEGNGPVHQPEEFGSGQPKPEDVYRIPEEGFRKIDSYISIKGTGSCKRLRMRREVWTSMKQAWSKTLGSHVSPWRETGAQTRRPASARRAPLQQNKRCEG